MPNDPQKISATDARNNFADIVNKVAYSGQEFLITRHDEIMARVVPAEAAAAKITAEPDQKETETTQQTPPAEEEKVTQVSTKEQEGEASVTEQGAQGEGQGLAAQQPPETKQPAQAQQPESSQPAQTKTQPEAPPKPKRIELEKIEAVEPVRPAGLRQSTSESDRKQEKKMSEEERLARIKARILKIYKG